MNSKGSVKELVFVAAIVFIMAMIAMMMSPESLTTLYPYLVSPFSLFIIAIVGVVLLFI